MHHNVEDFSYKKPSKIKRVHIKIIKYRNAKILYKLIIIIYALQVKTILKPKNIFVIVIWLIFVRIYRIGFQQK